MLTRFSVENFKRFKGKITLDLSNPGPYDFNSEVIANPEKVISKAIIYGKNGAGKSSLGLAIFDIILHLTDNEKNIQDYDPYYCLENEYNSITKFEYVFRFDSSEVIYKYNKIGLDKLIEERLTINDKEVLYYDFKNHDGFVSLKGTETLRFKVGDNQISRVKYVSSNAILTKTPENDAFLSFIDFVNHMLMFYSLDTKNYQGFMRGAENIGSAIIKAGKLHDFNTFLNENGVDLKLKASEINGEQVMLAHYNQRYTIDFFRIASTGTKSLALFYYWYIHMGKVAFVYLDEFDAFYHYELSETIVKLMKKLNKTQVIFTTHNTDLLSNDLLRPDCYFEIKPDGIHSLDQLTDKELRKEHNLQRMYKADAFRE